MDWFEIVASEASGEAVFSGFKLKWLSAFKMDKMVTRGRLSIRLQEAPKLSKEWGEGQIPKCGGEMRIESGGLESVLRSGRDGLAHLSA
jgi:hypothetical protein